MPACVMDFYNSFCDEPTKSFHFCSLSTMDDDDDDFIHHRREDDQPSTGAAALLATLQPVRDLAQNFDIDIASHLDEYLDKLLDVLEAERHGGSELKVRHGPIRGQQDAPSSSSSTLDFAQAALLVQHSSQVYSRKVDYFHTLVMKALEGLQQHNQTANNTNNNRTGGGRRYNSTSAEDQAFFDMLCDPDWDFLPLDDMVPMPKPEDITRTIRDKNKRWSTGSGILTTSGVDSSFHSHRSSFASRFSLLSSSNHLRQTRESSTSTSTSLLLLDEHSNDPASLPLRNSIPYRMPAYHSLNLVGSKCDMTPGGALLLPGVDPPLPDPTSDSSKFPSSPRNSLSNQEMGGANTSSPPEDAHAAEDDDFPPPDYDDRDDGGDDGPGYSFPTEDDGTTTQPASSVVSNVAPSNTNVQQHKRMVRFAANVSVNDPWAMLDPHQPSGTHRPLRKGRTVVLPSSVSELPSECVTGSRTKRLPKRLVKSNTTKTNNHKTDFRRAWTEGSLAVSVFRHVRHGAALETIPLSSELVFGDEFAYLLQQRQQAKMSERRRLARQQGRGHAHQDEAFEDEHAQIDVPRYHDKYDEGFGGFDDGGDDYDDYAYEDRGANGGEGLTGDGLDNTGNAGVITTVEDVFQENDNDGLTFEELCRAHIQKFAKGAEKYAIETKLLTRVRLWQEKIQPLLEEEEKRESFDILKYGQAIIASMKVELASSQDNYNDGLNEPGGVSFEAIARNCPQFDVPRLFLATLSLCNSGNIALDDSLNLVLLNSDIMHPMETFLAPSVRELESE